MRERLQKILSTHGVASRRESETIIAAGRVAVNGKTAALGDSADAACDVIEIDGHPIRRPDEKVYIMLNKPRGYVTSLRDEKGRRNVGALVESCGVRVYPVGRLDMDSEGLLLMTNDGELTNFLTHPSNEKHKVYQVSVIGDINAAVTPMSQSMEIDGYTIKPAIVKLLKKTDLGGILSVTIREGRNRQVRKMCEKCDLKVISLKRIAEGGVQLGNLKTGAWRFLDDAEVGQLKEKAQKDRSNMQEQ